MKISSPKLFMGRCLLKPCELCQVVSRSEAEQALPGAAWPHRGLLVSGFCDSLVENQNWCVLNQGREAAR